MEAGAVMEARAAMEARAVRFEVNGVARVVSVEPRATLVDALRDGLGLMGTHVGCAHGSCGACTVLVDGEAVRGCLMFAVQAEGRRVRTVEGLAGEELHPLQALFIEHHALQCGFCTPGFLMLGVGAVEAMPGIGEAELREVLASNLCRCTGYEGIVRAVLAYARGEGG